MEKIIEKEINKAFKKFLISLYTKINNKDFNVSKELEYTIDKPHKKTTTKTTTKKTTKKIFNFIESKRLKLNKIKLENNLILFNDFVIDEKTSCILYKIKDGVKTNLSKGDVEKCNELNLNYIY